MPFRQADQRAARTSLPRWPLAESCNPSPPRHAARAIHD